MTTAEIVRNGALLVAQVGSVAHGIALSGTDDKDYMGVCIEPKEYVIGLKHFEQHVYRTQPEGVRSGAGDIDSIVYSARKYASLALKGNPTILLLLYVPKEMIEYISPLGQELRDLHEAFASRRAGQCFLGYMTAQTQRLLGLRGQLRVYRQELIDKYGYDTKYAGHIIRLGFQGVEYLSSGRITLPMPEEQRRFVLAIREGKVEQDVMLTKAGELTAELKELLQSSPLPEEPDHERVNAWLCQAYTKAWSMQCPPNCVLSVENTK